MHRKIARISILAFAFYFSNSISASPAQEFSETAWITKETRLWTEPTKFGEPISILDPGLKLMVISYTTTSSWVRVRTPVGREGWVPARFTTLVGRRDQPLVAGGGSERALKARNPSSIVEGSPAAGKEEKVIDPPIPDWAVNAELGYVNDLSRGQASGVGVGLAVDHALGANFTMGLGFDFDFFTQSASDVVASASTSRSTIKLFPSVRASYVQSNFSLTFGLGVGLDHTSFDTRDLATNAQILASPSGLLVSGSEWNLQYFLKVAPTYRFPLSPKSSLGLGLVYDLILDGSSRSTFAGTAANQLMHVLGLSVSFSSGF